MAVDRASALLVLPAELTHTQARACLQGLLQGLRDAPGGQVVVDAGALASFDSSALAVLLECRRVAAGAGKRLAVRAMPQQLASLAQLYGVQELLNDAA